MLGSQLNWKNKTPILSTSFQKRHPLTFRDGPNSANKICPMFMFSQEPPPRPRGPDTPAGCWMPDALMFGSFVISPASRRRTRPASSSLSRGPASERLLYHSSHRLATRPIPLQAPLVPSSDCGPSLLSYNGPIGAPPDLVAFSRRLSDR